MNKTIDVTDLKPEQIAQLQAIIEQFKLKNQSQNNQSQIDMIEYLLENPIKVDNLEFIKREDIYDGNQ
jgi:Spy/CpxP family protein refolding chaperone